MDTSNEGIAQTLEAQRSQLATAIVDRQWELNPELAATYGVAGYTACVQDVSYSLSMLSAAIAAASPALFRNYISWLQVLCAGLRISTAELATSLEITGAVLRDRLSPQQGSIVVAYIEVGLEALHEAPDSLPASFLQPEQPLVALAQRYLETLLRAERSTASRLILEAVEAGTPVHDIYLHVFQPVQHEIGRLWQINHLSVAQEHYCTATTQLIMAQLYSHIMHTRKHGRSLVAACVGDELHEIGLRMVADFFEMAGWDTYYVGANVPTDSIISTVVEHQADLLVISITMAFHLGTLRSLIEQVRASPAGSSVKIMVGGYPFNVAPRLWQQLHADGYAPDAQAALDVARTLLHGGV